MKALYVLASLVLAVLAWAGATVDFLLARISELPRPYLVPGRTFHAVFRITYSYLCRRPLHTETFRIREYPRYRTF
jgi:hypothetical protein